MAKKIYILLDLESSKNVSAKTFERVRCTEVLSSVAINATELVGLTTSIGEKVSDEKSSKNNSVQ